MLDIDEQKLTEEAEKNLEDFLQKEQRSLVTFTGDSRLRYLPDKKKEKFLFRPSEGVLYLPLQSFIENELDHNQILWHIYYELALYPDWKKNTDLYLYRKTAWQKEIDHMARHLITTIEKQGMAADPAYQPDIIAGYIKKEILSFLYALDRYTAFLTVLQKCPIYREEGSFDKIVSFMRQHGKTDVWLNKMPKHRGFVNGFSIIELYKKIPQIEDCIKNPFDTRILKQSIYNFVRTGFITQINNGDGITQRDSFVRSFVYPIFQQLWKDEIDSMTFEESTGQTGEFTDDGKNPLESSEESESKDIMQSTMEDEEAVFREMLENQERLDENSQSDFGGKTDLSAYGVNQKDQELFAYYSGKMKPEREQMKKFWKKLIGDATKEINVKKTDRYKGNLSVDSLIRTYPSFMEAEKKGNYKNLPIFTEHMLERQTKKLPERIEISFVIDNSGSMDQPKIEAARKALAVTLLSIDDLNRYLKSSAGQQKKVEALSETWFFGNTYFNIKKFDNKNKSKEQSDIIRSIVKLDASGGATDDAACLREISNNITPFQERNLKRGKEKKIIFEITDGISSFPGSTKKTVEQLLSKNVDIYAFQIGKTNYSEKKTFEFIWNEGHKHPHGIVVGEDVERLPNLLLKTVGENINDAFKN